MTKGWSHPVASLPTWLACGLGWIENWVWLELLTWVPMCGLSVWLLTAWEGTFLWKGASGEQIFQYNQRETTLFYMTGLSGHIVLLLPNSTGQCKCKIVQIQGEGHWLLLDWGVIRSAFRRTCGMVVLFCQFSNNVIASRND